MIKNVDGKMYIRSGDGLYLYSGQEIFKTSRFYWQGVVVEFELEVPVSKPLSKERQQKLDDFAERIGI